MTELNKKASLGLAWLIVVMGAMTFLPAGTMNYWQAWMLLAVFFACTVAIDLYLVKNDPKLLERRLKAGPGSEQEKSQRSYRPWRWWHSSRYSFSQRSTIVSDGHRCRRICP